MQRQFHRVRAALQVEGVSIECSIQNETIAIARNADACVVLSVHASGKEQKRARQRGQNDHTFTVSLWQWHCPWRQGSG